MADGIYCYVDWDNDGDWDSSSEDVSAYLRSYSIKRGKDSNMGRAQVGTAQITLKDVAGTYIPSSTVSTLAGLIVPGRKVKIQRNYGGVEYVLFTGYLDDIQNDYSDKVREAYFSCTDGSERFANICPLADVRNWAGNPYIQEDVSSDTILTDAASEIPGSTAIIDASTYVYDYIFPGKLSLKTMIERFEDAEGAFFYISRSGVWRYEVAAYRATYHSTSEWTCPGTVWRSLKMSNNWKDVLNKLNMRHLRRETLTGFEHRIWEYPTDSTAGNTVMVEAGCSFSGWASPFVDTKGEVTSSKGLGFFDYVYSSSMGGGDYLATTSDGWVPDDELAFGDASYYSYENISTGTMYVTSFYKGGFWGETYGEARITSEDTASQDTYGLREKTLELEWAPTSSQMQTIADARVAAKKDATPTYVVELVPNSSDALTHALDLDISDRFTLQDSRISLSRDVYIDQVQHQWSVMDGVHHTYWTVSCAT
jgi:hypothetical protein